MQLYFIRHAQSANNALWAQLGDSKGRSHDPELTETGYRQAQALAEFLCRSNPAVSIEGRDPQNVAGFGLTHLYCSLMVRAVATGSIVAEALKLPLVAWPDVHESGGIYLDDEVTGEPIGLPGNSRSYFEANYPGLVLPDSLAEQGWWNRPHEPAEERPIRAQRFWHELCDRHGATNDRVAVFSHGGFYHHWLTALLGMPEREDLWFSMNNTAITRIDQVDQYTNVIYTNRVDFLPRELVT